MRKKILISFFTLALVLFCVGFKQIEVNAASTTYGGNFENCEDTLFKGWAWNSAAPNDTIQVHIYITNTATGERTGIPLLANQYRPDLYAAGIGNGYHAFSYDMNWYNFAPGTYTVEAYAYNPNGTSPQLANSPRTFTVSGPTGNFESVSDSNIKGWAYKPQSPSNSVQVHVYLTNTSTNQQYALTTFANQYRPDLYASGIGNGYHAFDIPINWNEYPKGYYSITAYAFVNNAEKASIGTRNYSNGYQPPNFIWPVGGGYVSQGFKGNDHKGIDIASYGANLPIYASKSGYVTFAGWNNGGYGNCILIDHGNGYVTRYAHLSRINVSVGTNVTQGQIIGIMGSTGDSSGIHLHFEMIFNGNLVNPLDYVNQ